jgi:hypothetical protein
MTTYELAAELKREDVPACLRDELLPVLRESDLVKFAKQIPTLAQAEKIVDLGFSIVDRTKAQPRSSPGGSCKMSFANPELFWLFLLIPGIAYRLFLP